MPLPGNNRTESAPIQFTWAENPRTKLLLPIPVTIMSTVVTVFCQSCNREIVSSPADCWLERSCARHLLGDTLTVTQDQGSGNWKSKSIHLQRAHTQTYLNIHTHTQVEAIFRRLGFDWPAAVSLIEFFLFLLLVCCLFHFCFLPVYFFGLVRFQLVFDKTERQV